MSVEKFRSAEEMNAQPPRVTASDGFERFVRQCARYRRIAPLVFPRGVFKFRNIEEAQEARAAIARENAHRLRDGSRER